jgi:hypothetical protein
VRATADRTNPAPGLPRILAAGASYCALVFGAGFVLGTLRVLFVTPPLSARAAELLEMPLMLAVIVVAARWIVRRFRLPRASRALVGVGLVAFALFIVVELAAALALQGLSPREFLATRDPVSGTAFYAVLVVFALMPLLLRRYAASDDPAEPE